HFAAFAADLDHELPSSEIGYQRSRQGSIRPDQTRRHLGHPGATVHQQRHGNATQNRPVESSDDRHRRRPHVPPRAVALLHATEDPAPGPGRDGGHRARRPRAAAASRQRDPARPVLAALPPPPRWVVTTYAAINPARREAQASGYLYRHPDGGSNPAFSAH